MAHALHRVAESDGDPWQVPVALASLRRARLPRRHGAPRREDLPRVPREDGNTDARLAAIGQKTKGLFLPGLVAKARTHLAQVRGSVEGAEAARRQSGARASGRRPRTSASRASRSAVEPPPSSTRRTRGLRQPRPRLRARTAGGLPAATPASRWGCRLELGSISGLAGMREVVVDVAVPESGRLGLMLITRSPAALRAGGREVLERPLGLGGELPPAPSSPRPRASSALVVRVGQSGTQDAIELYAWGDDGAPLATSAPRPGEAATGRATKTTCVGAPAVPKAKGHDGDALVAGLAELASRYYCDAEERLHAASTRSPDDPALALAYAWAVRLATD